jgi:hypothetical protein
MPTNLDIADEFLKAMGDAATPSERSNEVLKFLKEQAREEGYGQKFRAFVAPAAKIVVSSTVDLIDATVELTAAWQICSEKQDPGNLKNVQASLDKLRTALIELNEALDIMEAKAKEYTA